MTDSEKLIAEEKAKRKELSRVRIFWFCIVASAIMVVVIIVQAMILAGN